MEGLATAAEVADYLKVKPETLRVWAHRKKGPAYIMIEGRRRYEWADVRAYLEARKVVHQS